MDDLIRFEAFKQAARNTYGKMSNNAMAYGWYEQYGELPPGFGYLDDEGSPTRSLARAEWGQRTNKLPRFVDDGVLAGGEEVNNRVAGHIPKRERDRLHKPQSDWRESKLGEKCYNSSSLEIEDILDKRGLVSR